MSSTWIYSLIAVLYTWLMESLWQGSVTDSSMIAMWVDTCLTTISYMYHIETNPKKSLFLVLLVLSVWLRTLVQLFVFMPFIATILLLFTYIFCCVNIYHTLSCSNLRIYNYYSVLSRHISIVHLRLLTFCKDRILVVWSICLYNEKLPNESYYTNLMHFLNPFWNTLCSRRRQKSIYTTVILWGLSYTHLDDIGFVVTGSRLLWWLLWQQL